jgi:hypothetical protein
MQTGGGDLGPCQRNGAGSYMSWLEDGVLACASEIVVDRTPAEGCDSFDARGVDFGDGGTDPRAVLFGVVACGGPLAGTHDCFPIPDGGTTLVGFAGDGTTLRNCRISITNPGVLGGAHATGTFSAAFAGAGGAVITNGVFDVVVEVRQPAP